MTDTNVTRADLVETTPENVVRDWLARFGDALGRGDVAGVAALMSTSGMWKDVYALTWDLTPARGREEIAQLLTEYLRERPITDVEFDPIFTVDVDALGIIRAMFSFRTDITVGRGVLRLVKEDDEYLAFSVSTELRGLIDHPRPAPGIKDATRDEWNKLSPVSSGLKASTDRTAAFKAPEYTDHDPDVLIVGGGQAGLILAARMTEEGLDTLVVDKYERAGDSWRQRYDSLKLHDSKWYSELPYLPYPPTWPLFTPKNSIADWIEVFVWAMGVKLWTQSPAVAAKYDAEAERWDVTIDRQGVERTLHPRHLVFATGFNRLPVMPEVPGAQEFQGYVSHSATYRGSTQFKGKKVLVVGTGSSGMDLAKDAFDGGAQVTLLQRGPTYIMSTRHGVPMTFGEYYSENSPPADISDSLGGSLPLSFMMENWPHTVRAIAEQDRDMIAGLKEAGFEWYAGPGDAGLLFLSLHKGGGYYIDNGAADLIITGKIAVKHGCLERFTAHGVVLDDGSEMDVDAVVFSTGFANMRDSLRPVLGDEVADGLATVWGLDEKGELRTTFRHTGHPRLWAFTGGIQQCRFHSRPFAVMVKAIELGLVSPDISVKLKPSEFWRTEFDFAPPPDADYLHDVDGGLGA